MGSVLPLSLTAACSSAKYSRLAKKIPQMEMSILPDAADLPVR